LSSAYKRDTYAVKPIYSKSRSFKRVTTAEACKQFNKFRLQAWTETIVIFIITIIIIIATI